ncbi:MAG: MraZ C-terminal domain-containing protein, partial [Blastocatellia bacterium]
YYGQTAEIDAQGRILVHPLLRESAQLVAEVDVLGYLQYIEVWSANRFKAKLESQPYTDEDAASIALLGI